MNVNTTAVANILLKILTKTINAKSNDKIAVLEGLISKSFTPVSNSRKLSNGRRPYDAVHFGLLKLNFRRFRDAVTEDMEPFINHLLKNINDLKDKTGCFFVTRQDLSSVQQLVQTAHVAAVMGQREKLDMNHTNFIVLGVSNETELLETLGNLRKSVGCYTFSEPDMDNQITSLVTPPIRYSLARRLKALRNLTLLKL